MRKIILILSVLIFVLGTGQAQTPTILDEVGAEVLRNQTPTPARHQSLEEANRRIQELEAENEAMQIQHENENLQEMSHQYDVAHPYPYYVPYPCYAGWGGFHYHPYPMYMHHHDYHHDHHYHHHYHHHHHHHHH